MFLRGEIAGLALLLWGCSFDPSTTQGAGDAGALADSGPSADASTAPDASLIDAAPGDPDAAPGDPDAAPAKPLCDSTLAELVACYLFEDGAGATTLADSSMYGNHATVSGALFTTGLVGEAFQGSGGFDSLVNDSASLDATTGLTIEGWIHPDGSVTSGRQGLFDNQGQYGFFIVTQDALRCTAGGLAALSPNDQVKSGEWQHVACAYDGSTLRLFHNGIQVAMETGGGNVSTGGTTGSGIAEDSPDGDEFIGKVDTLRIWNTGRSITDLCQAAGLTVCPGAIN